MTTLSDELPHSLVTTRAAWFRLGVGLLQAVALYALYFCVKHELWPATQAMVWNPLLLISLIVPLLVMTGAGHVRAKPLAVWAGVATLIAAGVQIYDVWSLGAQAARYESRPMPNLLVMFLTGVGFYIGHTLVVAAAMDGRRIARYATYFEYAWKLLIQFKLSGVFVGMLWLVLWLGAVLFTLVQLPFLKELLEQAWFSIPVTVLALALALHLTDVRPSLVRGIRSLLLMLLSWLLPLITVVVSGFLISLLFTGLAPLWATKQATLVLLGTSALLIVLINAAFQDRHALSTRTAVLRVSARVAAGLLLPLVIIALYALGLRVHDHGWTVERIWAAACLCVASCYAVGYAWAALSRRGHVLNGIATTNIGAACLVLALLLALLSPVADPVRLSVTNQLARLQQGKVSPAKFDFNYLAHEGRRYGLRALEQLKNDARLPVRLQAQTALNLAKDRLKGTRQKVPVEALTQVELQANVRVHSNKVIPLSFWQQDWAKQTDAPLCLRMPAKSCEAYLLDFTRDGKDEILLLDTNSGYGRALVFREQPIGQWHELGSLNSDLTRCKAWQEALMQGRYQLVAPPLSELDIQGQRFRVYPTGEVKCPSNKPNP